MLHGTEIVGDPAFTVTGSAKGYLGWHYRGIKDKSESGGDGHTSHYDYVQAHFNHCVIKVGCANDFYPWIKKWQYGDGTHRYDRRK